MKRIILTLAVLAFALYSCRNFDIAHPDFKYTSGYFPYQFPVRTIILGDYIYDNSSDNNHQFVISIHLGGLRENNNNRSFQVEIDNSLCDSVLFSADGDTIRAMPAKYYTLETQNIVIPKGKMYAGVTVQLTDEFFNDPEAIRLSYVVPLRITGSNDVDTILMGKTERSNADPRIASDWDVPPKDFTMFAVKYINEYHGTYFYYGESEVKDATGNMIEDSTYEKEYMVNNSTVKLVTTGRHQVLLNTTLRDTTMTGTVEMILSFDGNNCTISAADDSLYTISGAGEFKPDAYSWGDKKRNGIVLNYTISDGEHTYTASDVLVSRDRGVVMETYTPVNY